MIGADFYFLIEAGTSFDVRRDKTLGCMERPEVIRSTSDTEVLHSSHSFIASICLHPGQGLSVCWVMLPYFRMRPEWLAILLSLDVVEQFSKDKFALFWNSLMPAEWPKPSSNSPLMLEIVSGYTDLSRLMPWLCFYVVPKPRWFGW